MQDYLLLPVALGITNQNKTKSLELGTKSVLLRSEVQNRGWLAKTSSDMYLSFLPPKTPLKWEGMNVKDFPFYPCHLAQVKR